MRPSIDSLHSAYLRAKPPPGHLQVKRRFVENPGRFGGQGGPEDSRDGPSTLHLQDQSLCQYVALSVERFIDSLSSLHGVPARTPPSPPHGDPGMRGCPVSVDVSSRILDRVWASASILPNLACGKRRRESGKHEEGARTRRASMPACQGVLVTR